MHREHAINDFLNIIDKFRKNFKNITLSTDIIVGFPGEEEEDFQDTIKLLYRIKADIVNLSKFGPRFGTEAALLPQIDNKIIKFRSREIYNIMRKISLENNMSWIGWTGNAFIDERVNNAVVGRNFAYKPIIIKSLLPIGEFVKVTIIDCTSNSLIGNILK
jgi:tRNA A37 methylthiotransferase MiaB